MGKIEDIRIETIMPVLSIRWLLLDWEQCLRDVHYPIKKYKENDYLTNGTYAIIDQGKELIAGFTNDLNYLYTDDLPIIIFGDHTRVIKIINFPFALGADGCKLIVPIDVFNRYYFYYYLICLKIGYDGYSRHYKYLKTIKVPLPPLNEQKQIVEKLDAILPKVKSAKEKLRKIPSILKKFRQSVLTSACSGRLTEEWREGKDLTKGETEETKADYYVDIYSFPLVWDKLKLETVSDYYNGFQFKSSKYIPTSKNQVIRIGNVKRGYIAIDESPVYIDDDYANENTRFEILENDILLSLTGTKYKQDYGFACLVQRPQHRYFLNQRVAALRAKDKIKPEYLILYLQTNFYRDVFFSNETGNANQGNVGIDSLVYPLIGVPSVEEQQEIIRRVEKLFALADSLEAKYKKALARVEKIEQSILAKAFRGELLEPDPNDEPAEELLKRILEEKAKLDGIRKVKSNTISKKKRVRLAEGEGKRKTNGVKKSKIRKKG